jgi:hypothetical protein
MDKAVPGKTSVTALHGELDGFGNFIADKYFE